MSMISRNSVIYFWLTDNVGEQLPARGGRPRGNSFRGTKSHMPASFSLQVEADDTLAIRIKHGLLLATCLPDGADANKDDPEILFRAEFYGLAGSGRIKLASTR